MKDFLDCYCPLVWSECCFNRHNSNYGLRYYVFIDMMQPMFSNKDTTNALVALGERLRTTRIARGDSQALFAHRLGVAIPTLRAMEQGLPTVAVGAWVAALWMLSRIEDIERVLEKQESLFERAASPRKPRIRVARRGFPA